eukprot:2221671-Pyramimonas_sp.AAC.2
MSCQGAHRALAPAVPEREVSRRLSQVELHVVLLPHVACQEVSHRDPDEAPCRPAVKDRPDAARVVQEEHQLAQLEERERFRLG